MRMPFALLLAALLSSPLIAQQDFSPPPTQKTDDAVRKTIGEKADKLNRQLAELRRLNVSDQILVEIEVYLKAAVWIVKHDDFFHKDAADWTVKVLDRELVARQSGGLGGDAVAFGTRGARLSVPIARRSTARCSRSPSPIRPTTARIHARSTGSTSCCTAGTPA